MTALEDAESFARAQADCLSRVQAQGFGLSSSQVDSCLASGRWVALFEAVYLVDAYALDPRHLPFSTQLGAALLNAGPNAVACLETSAAVHALPTPPRFQARVKLILPPGKERHQRPGVDLHFRRLDPTSIVARTVPWWPWPIRCTSVLQTAADALRTWSGWDSVSLLDAAIAAGQLTLGWQDAIVTAVHGQRGAVAARRRALLADGRSQSPLETRVRLIAGERGRPPDELQYEVRDRRGVLLGYGDLAWHLPDGRVLIVECDGKAWHESPAAVLRDRRRGNDFSAVGGIDVVRFTWDDTRRPSYIRHVLDQHLSLTAPRRRPIG
jgi:hypothetical protein